MIALLNLESIAGMWASMTSRELAHLLGMTPVALRSRMSRHGVRCPRSIEAERRRRVILKLHRMGWGAAAIADQMESTPIAVRMVIRRASMSKHIGEQYTIHFNEA